jgi:hypothetical protein
VPPTSFVVGVAEAEIAGITGGALHDVEEPTAGVTGSGMRFP